MAMFEPKKWLTPKRLDALEQLDLHSVSEVLSYYPRRYADFSPTSVAMERHGQRVCVHGHVVGVSKMAFIRRNFTRFTIHVAVDSDEFKVAVYNRPYLYKNVQVGQPIVIAGKLDYWKHEITGTDIFPSGLALGDWLQPIYRLKAGIPQHYFRTLMAAFLKEYGNQSDLVPEVIRESHRLLPRTTALTLIHQPTTTHELAHALHTLKYEEFFLFSLQQLALKRLQQNTTHHGLQWNTHQMNEWIQHLPYQLTSDQHHAINDILADLESSSAMYRLLQGDVGSGKTVVAAAALAATAWSGHQAALMAPTEILARQHYLTLQSLFQTTTLRLGLLTGSTSASERRVIHEQLRTGELDILIGTHAIFQEAVDFQSLRLAIIDEQHRFGVDQRLQLKQKGNRVDMLMLSATPIPRTLALTLYGDMDISTLTQFPSAKRRVQTHFLPSNSIRQVVADIERELAQGGQLYVICPLIEAEEDTPSDHRTVTEIYHSMQSHYRGRFQVGLLHGRMSNDEKNLAMKRFQSGDTHILVATTVVEVGVDVKRATQMVIYDAEFFGLSQLHQLRGRIGRAGQEGHCYVLSNDHSPEVTQRLIYFATEDDGFELARYDLEHRGPGDLLGLRQSGFAEFILGDFQQDMRLLDIAQKDAHAWWHEHPLEQWPDSLRYAVIQGYEKIADVGSIW